MCAWLKNAYILIQLRLSEKEFIVIFMNSIFSFINIKYLYKCIQTVVPGTRRVHFSDHIFMIKAIIVLY